MNYAAKIKEQMEIAHKLARVGDYEGAFRIYSELKDAHVDMDSISDVDRVKRGLERERALDEKLNQIFNEVDEVTEDEIRREMEKSNANTKVYEIPVKDEKSISSIIKTICKSNLVKKICSEEIPENCCYSPVVKDDDVVFLKIDVEHESITYIQKTKSGKMKRIVSYYMHVSPDAPQSASASS